MEIVLMFLACMGQLGVFLLLTVGPGLLRLRDSDRKLPDTAWFVLISLAAICALGILIGFHLGCPACFTGTSHSDYFYPHIELNLFIPLAWLLCVMATFAGTRRQVRMFIALGFAVAGFTMLGSAGIEALDKLLPNSGYYFVMFFASAFTLALFFDAFLPALKSLKHLRVIRLGCAEHHRESNSGILVQTDVSATVRTAGDA